MSTRPVITFVVFYYDAAEPWAAWLAGLRSAARAFGLSVELLVAANGRKIKNASVFDNSGVPWRALSAPHLVKPQDLVALSVRQAAGRCVIFHSAADKILPSYGRYLKKHLSAVKSGVALKLPRRVASPSALFSRRVTLSGYCFLKSDLRRGLPFDFMFRQNETGLISRQFASTPLFTISDLPLFKPKRRLPFISVVVTIKNRLKHWQQSMPYLVSQRGVDYELLLVDYHSEDNFLSALRRYLSRRRRLFSHNLKQITVVHLLENKKFSSCKAKNLGARAARGRLLAFTDVDTFIREDYTAYWADRARRGGARAFVVTRAARDRRLSTEVNYGNMVVPRALYFKVAGHNENIRGYGGDEDEFIHRLRNAGGREINPATAAEARQYSILHGHEERMKFLEFSGKSGLQNWKFLRSRRARWTTGDDWGRQPAQVWQYFFDN